MPTAGRKIEEFEQRLDAQLTGEPPKRGPGRPPKQPEPEPIQADIRIIKSLLAMPFDLWASRVGVTELKLTTKETDLLAVPVKELLDHYLPLIPPIAWAWISLAVTSYTIMKIRLALLATLREQQSKSAMETDGSPRTGQGRPPSSTVKMPGKFEPVSIEE